MRGKSITRSGIILISAFVATLWVGATITTFAQQQDTAQSAEPFSIAFSKADAECKALWADHAFDPLRDKFVLTGDKKPTFAMLTDKTRVLPKDRPLADLAIKTVEKCRALYAASYAMTSEQTKLQIKAAEREQDALLARLYVGKISIGEYNVGMNKAIAEMLKILYGNAQTASSEAGQAQVPAKTTQSSVQQQPIVLQTRLALVIGNSNYAELPKLKNPANDARAIVNALRELGFDATLIMDASETNIRRAVRKFADQSDQADIALVYFAGHGAEVNGENYLLPVDMEVPRTESDIQLSSLKMDDLVNSLRSTTKILFLDACRDNPALFKNLVKGRGAVAVGLAPTQVSHLSMRPGGGVFIAYAADAGSVALEGEGDHSPFTRALLKNLKKSISLDDMFSFVTKEVSLVTQGVQRPYKYASLVDPICLTGTCSSAASAATTDIVQEARRSVADELQIALQTNNRVALESYLDKYPDSSDRPKVLAEIARLKRSEFNEWTLFQISNGRFPAYLKLSSIRLFGDRVAVGMRTPVDPTIPVFGSLARLAR